tara:strand:+ start:15496 stop:15945 length:450 start_codon:yes stop_codon:yes gene_type:complete
LKKSAPVKEVIDRIPISPEARHLSSFFDADDIIWCHTRYIEEDDIWEADGEPWAMTKEEILLFKLKNENVRLMNMTEFYGMTPGMYCHSILINAQDRMEKMIKYAEEKEKSMQTISWQNQESMYYILNEINKVLKYKNRAVQLNQIDGD